MKNMNNKTFVSIYHPHDSVHAGLISSALEHAGIVCYVNNENLSAIHMGSIGIGACSMAVMVPEDKAEEAINIIHEAGIE